MALIAAAGVNMAIFEFITVRDVQKWNLDPTPPPAAWRAGGISIACWVLVIFFGRLIAFTLPTE
jgi:disulfide bond formation protein DsbB